MTAGLKWAKENGLRVIVRAKDPVDQPKAGVLAAMVNVELADGSVEELVEVTPRQVAACLVPRGTLEQQLRVGRFVLAMEQLARYPAHSAKRVPRTRDRRGRLTTESSCA